MSKEIKNFIHSLSTTPFKINCYNISGKDRLFGNIWFYSLSVAYIKKLGLRINLHTDELGKMALDHLPYDEIFVDCEDLDKEIHPRFWAAAKFVAMRNEGIDTIHIDGDVFIKNGDIIKDIAESDWDVLVQSYEDGNIPWYTSLNEFVKTFDKYLTKEYNLDYMANGAYNTGVVGFRDEKRHKQFVEDYFKLAKFLSTKLNYVFNHTCTLTPDMLVEQKRIYQNNQKAKERVKTILKGRSLTEMSDYATKIGYQHICSPTKFDYIPELKETLKRINSNIFDKTNDKIEFLSEQLR